MKKKLKYRFKLSFLIVFYALCILNIVIFGFISRCNNNFENLPKVIYVFNPKSNYYFGSLHGHYVEGKTTAEVVISTAKDISKLDFYGLTEHDRFLNQNVWKSLMGLTDNFLSKKFILLIGYEIAYIDGHLNVFNSNEVIEEKTRIGLYDWLTANPDVIVQWNHPENSPSYSFNKFSDYSPAYNKGIKMFEIYNDLDNINQRDYEFNYQLALDTGWKVGPTANPDAHTIEQLIANRSRTVIMAKELSKDSLLDGIRRLKFYATQDPGMKIIYELNGLDMGSNVPWTENLDFYVNAQTQTDNCINNIQIISNGGEVVDNRYFQKTYAERKVTLTQEYNTNKYYYAKIVTCSGLKAWTAPIWVEGI